MADQFRILVVEEEETLNQSIVNSLRKDGYLVQGVMSGAEAIRILWSEECDVVISDQKTPGADGFELLQWLRTYRSDTRMIMLSASGSPGKRTQALESGAVSYLEKPLDLHLLKEELRRLLQQTGFSASLDSFDLLDVIQIINMSRKSIAMLVNTGLEEHGMLRFQDGELIWAEYGILRGEEAFFALAAHKNGTVVHQPWNEQISPNVAQPLSRLIFQALQYRSKYAVRQQLTGEQAAVSLQAAEQAPVAMSEEIDDTPFIFAFEAETSLAVEESRQENESQVEAGTARSQEQRIQQAEDAKEWWQDTGHGRGSEEHQPASRRPGRNGAGANGFSTAGRLVSMGESNITPSTVHKTPAGQRPDLPSWLTEQPTRADMSPLPPQSPQRSLRPSALSGSDEMPVPPIVNASHAEWQAPDIAAVPTSIPPTTPIPPSMPIPVPPTAKTTGQLQQRRVMSGPQRPVRPGNRSQQNPAEWQPPSGPTGQNRNGQQPRSSQSGPLQSGPLQSLVTPTSNPRVPGIGDIPATNGRQRSGPLRITTNEAVFTNPNIGAVVDGRAHGNNGNTAAQQQRREREPAAIARRNYPALVSALQTLGYAIPGFIAAAVVGLDGQPVAQVAVDDLDIAPMCGFFTTILHSALRSLNHGGWGSYEETVITSADRRILLRLIGNNSGAFQVLITTREAEPTASLAVMANVEGAISAALR